jgi:aminopeptidase-like protein
MLYHTSYCRESWGLCRFHKQMLALPESNYEASIDSPSKTGTRHTESATCQDAGPMRSRVMPVNLANDNLYGVTVAAFLERFLARRELPYSGRFLYKKSRPSDLGSQPIED